MQAKYHRFISIALTCLMMGLGVALILWPLRDQVVFFVTPSELAMRPELADRTVRVGGYVASGSIQEQSLATHHQSTELLHRIKRTVFALTDHQTQLSVRYDGVLPAMFREGQGIVAEGRMTANHELHATRLLTKHDERYRPPSTPSTPSSQAPS